MSLFPPLLGYSFNQEYHHGKDKKPSVFTEKENNLSSRSEDEAHDRSKQAGQNGAYLFALF